MQTRIPVHSLTYSPIGNIDPSWSQVFSNLGARLDRFSKVRVDRSRMGSFKSYGWSAKEFKNFERSNLYEVTTKRDEKFKIGRVVKNLLYDEG